MQRVSVKSQKSKSIYVGFVTMGEQYPMQESKGAS
jgi:hypothetical protein